MWHRIKMDDIVCEGAEMHITTFYPFMITFCIYNYDIEFKIPVDSWILHIGTNFDEAVYFDTLEDAKLYVRNLLKTIFNDIVKSYQEYIQDI